MHAYFIQFSRYLTWSWEQKILIYAVISSGSNHFLRIFSRFLYVTYTMCTYVYSVIAYTRIRPISTKLLSVLRWKIRESLNLLLLRNHILHSRIWFLSFIGCKVSVNSYDIHFILNDHVYKKPIQCIFSFSSLGTKCQCELLWSPDVQRPCFCSSARQRFIQTTSPPKPKDQIWWTLPGISLRKTLTDLFRWFPSMAYLGHKS